MPSTYLTLERISVVFRVHGIGAQSLKKQLISYGTGGRLARDASMNFVVHALQDLTIDLQEGARLGIVGANGAGKSTLLRVMAGIYTPQTGSVRHQGTLVSLIDTSVGLEPHATGYENIRTRAVLMGIARRHWAAFEERVAEICELGDYLAMPMHTYSSGMRMRLSFAISISRAPDILLLDEWLSAGDEAFRAKAEKHMNALAERARILVLASHNLALLERVCTHGLMLHAGEAVTAGPIKEVTAHYRQHAAAQAAA
jgi:ABC-type polysaccharide/polyol phosphate transport system ATPase subunit